MRVAHARFVDCPQNAGFVNEVFQIMRTTCPLCHKDVQFAIQQDDKDYAATVEYQEFVISKQSDDIVRLKIMIDRILEIKK